MNVVGITRQSGRGTSGFTLIELLVVIAIIALLVSILMPSLGRAKELAKAAVCSVNMRSFVTAEQMYNNEYGGQITPPAGTEEDWRWSDPGDEPWGDISGYYGGWYRQRNTWADMLYWNGYAGSTRIFTCPKKSWTDAEANSNSSLAHFFENRAPQSYGMNDYFEIAYKEKAARKMDDVREPAEVVIFTPSVNMQPRVQVWDGKDIYSPDSMRHEDIGAAYGFCDGHAEIMTFREIFGVEYDPGQGLGHQIALADDWHWYPWD